MKRKIRLIKIKNRHPADEDDRINLPLGYYIEGYLQSEIKIGESVHLYRTNKNGKKSLGMIKTSLVEEITTDGFKTSNSEYVLEFLH